MRRGRIEWLLLAVIVILPLSVLLERLAPSWAERNDTRSLNEIVATPEFMSNLHEEFSATYMHWATSFPPPLAVTNSMTNLPTILDLPL